MGNTHKQVLFFAFIMVLFVSACVQHNANKDQTDRKKGDQPKDKAKPTYASVNTWIDDLKNFRTAVYQQDVAKIKTYFNFPVVADTTQIWEAVYDQMDESKRPQIYPATFTEADLDKYHLKLFNASFIQSLLKVKSEQLYREGEYTTPVIKKVNQNFHMLAQYNKHTSILELSVMFSGWKDENGEEMSEGESAVIYFFKVVGGKYLKFNKILLAG